MTKILSLLILTILTLSPRAQSAQINGVYDLVPGAADAKACSSHVVIGRAYHSPCASSDQELTALEWLVLSKTKPGYGPNDYDSDDNFFRIVNKYFGVSEEKSTYFLFTNGSQISPDRQSLSEHIGHCNLQQTDFGYFPRDSETYFFLDGRPHRVETEHIGPFPSIVNTNWGVNGTQNDTPTRFQGIVTSTGIFITNKNKDITKVDFEETNQSGIYSFYLSRKDSGRIEPYTKQCFYKKAQ